MTVDNSYFAGLGCFESTDCLPETLKNSDPPIDSIEEPSNFLGGLDPALPIAKAATYGFNVETTPPAFYTTGCMIPQYVRYLVLVEYEIQLIDSAEEMRQLYAPIETPEEALSFAMAVTGYEALYDLKGQFLLNRIANPLEESNVIFDGEAYIVHLFDTNICGCGPHVVESIDVSVFPGGSYILDDPVQAYSDPKTDLLCID